MSQILGVYNKPHTWKIHKHRGVGKLQEDMAANPKLSDPTLLYNLPAKLRAYGRNEDEQLGVVVLVDLDAHQGCLIFKQMLLRTLDFGPKKLAACSELPLRKEKLGCLEIDRLLLQLILI